MALKPLKDINKIDTKLTKAYENQTTNNIPTNFVDRSEDLLAQMNFIAMRNKSILNLR